MRSLRRRDQLAAAPGGAPTAPSGTPLSGAVFEGRWLNTATAPQGLRELQIHPSPAGGRGLRSFDAAGGVVDWEPQSLAFYSHHPGSQLPTALTAACRVGGRSGLLQGSLNLGLLVLALYRRSGAGGVGYFSREFFLRVGRPEDAALDTPAAGGLFPEVGEPVEADAQPFGGRWLNTDPDSPGICRIEIDAAAGGAPRVRAWGAGEPQSEPGARDWGAGETSLYATVDEAGQRTACLLAAYDFGFMRSELQLRISGGALVLANFNRFADASGRRDYFTREFYRRG